MQIAAINSPRKRSAIMSPWITKKAPSKNKTYLELVIDRLQAKNYKFALVRNKDMFPDVNAPLK